MRSIVKIFKSKEEPVISTEENPILYKYAEDRILKELKEYVDQTYEQHYSQNKFQATEFIIDSGHGKGFAVGNIMKYIQRYGKKGTREAKVIISDKPEIKTQKSINTNFFLFLGFIKRNNL